ncbi:MAG TPA: response regulator [Bacteroidota bacterium]|nr:response regulator [Bacteroidota bacterium]
MKLVTVEYGIFPEIEGLNKNFHKGSSKLRILLDTTLENSLLGSTKALDLTLFNPFFTTLSIHQCGCGTKRGYTNQEYSYLPSDTIVKLEENIDIAHYMEHMILDLQFELGTKNKISGVTVSQEGSTTEFMTYVECDDVHLGMFALNIVLAMMHQALYCGEIDPRYHMVLKIAKWLRQSDLSKVSAEEVAKKFSIDDALVYFCLNALNTFQFSSDRISLLDGLTPETVGPILIIEDDELGREMLNDALTGLGYQTMTAADGRTGIQLLSEYHASIVLLDIYLPDTDGVSIAKWILETQPSTIIILMSGMIETKNGESFSSDAVRFIPKPFSISHLDNILRVAHNRPIPSTPSPVTDAA